MNAIYSAATGRAQPRVLIERVACLSRHFRRSQLPAGQQPQFARSLAFSCKKICYNFGAQARTDGGAGAVGACLANWAGLLQFFFWWFADWKGLSICFLDAPAVGGGHWAKQSRTVLGLAESFTDDSYLQKRQTVNQHTKKTVDKRMKCCHFFHVRLATLWNNKKERSDLSLGGGKMNELETLEMRSEKCLESEAWKPLGRNTYLNITRSNRKQVNRETSRLRSTAVQGRAT